MLWIPISLLALTFVFIILAVVSYYVEKNYHGKRRLTYEQHQELYRLEHWND
jgi:hypothetical protein